MYSENIKTYSLLTKNLNEKNSQNWYDILIRFGDKDIIIQNMEFYISSLPSEKEAWKLYIEFLGNCNPKVRFSKHCNIGARGVRSGDLVYGNPDTPDWG